MTDIKSYPQYLANLPPLQEDEKDVSYYVNFFFHKHSNAVED